MSRRRDGLTPRIRTARKPRRDRWRPRPRPTNVRRSLIRRPLDKGRSRKPTERASETSSTPTTNRRRSTTSSRPRGRRGHGQRSSIKTRRPRRCPISTPSPPHRRIIVAACLYTSICRRPQARPLNVLRRPGEWAPEAASKVANGTHRISPPRLTAAGRNRTCGIKIVQVKPNSQRRHRPVPARSSRWPPKCPPFLRCRPNTDRRTRVSSARPRPPPPPPTRRRMPGTTPRRLSRKVGMPDPRLRPARTTKRPIVIKARRRQLRRTCTLASR